MDWIGEILCRLGIHRWRIAEDTGMTRYVYCRRCGARDVYQYASGGHQPIDPLWVAEGRFTNWSKVRPPAGMRSAVQPPTHVVEIKDTRDGSAQ